MYPAQQTLRDELNRQWQPYGPVAAFWADQLVNAMIEFDRVQSLNAGQAASFDEHATVLMGATNPYSSDEMRTNEARYLAFVNSKVDSMKLLLRLNQQAMARIEQINRMLNQIKRETVPASSDHPAPSQSTVAAQPAKAEAEAAPLAGDTAPKAAQGVTRPRPARSRFVRPPGRNRNRAAHKRVILS